MSIRKINFFFILITAVCAFNACVDSDRTMGVDFVPDNQLLKIDRYEFSVPITTTSVDSINTSYSGVAAIGYMKNDPFGVFDAGTVFRLLPGSLNFTYPEGATLDSAVFSVPISRRMETGDGRSVAQSLAFYKLNRNLRTGTYYYNNSLKDGDYDLTAISEPFSYTGTDTITMRLTEDFAKELMNATETDVSSDTSFLKAFKGVYLAADASNAASGTGGRLTYFGLSNALLTVYYHKDATQNSAEADTTRYSYYVVDDYSPNFNVFKHGSAHLANTESSTIYIEGLAGVKPYLDANTIQSKIQHLVDSLKATAYPDIDISKIAINKAEVQLPAAYPEYAGPSNAMATYPSATALAYGLKDSSYSLVYDTYLTYFDGTLNRSLQQYTYNLTYYTQGLYTKHSYDNTEAARKLMIFPSVTSTGYYSSTIDLDRTYYSFGVLRGPEVKIKFTYTVLK